MRRSLVAAGLSAVRLPGLLRAASALAAETMVVMIRPKKCKVSDRKEDELRDLGVPYVAFNPIDHLQQSVQVMTTLFDSGVTGGPNPVMVVNGVPLRTNDMKELKALLRYRN